MLSKSSIRARFKVKMNAIVLYANQNLVCLRFDNRKINRLKKFVPPNFVKEIACIIFDILSIKITAN